MGVKNRKWGQTYNIHFKPAEGRFTVFKRKAGSAPIMFDLIFLVMIE